MKRDLYITHLSVLLIFIGASYSETITADIVKGYSWEYYESYYRSNGAEKNSGVIKVSIDSVWNNSSDTLFFRVNRADSIYSEVKDSTIINYSQIYAK